MMYSHVNFQWELYMHSLFAWCVLSETATLSIWKLWTYLCVWRRFFCPQIAYIWSTNLIFITGKNNWRTQSGHISYQIIYWLMDVLAYIHRFLLSITVNNHIKYMHTTNNVHACQNFCTVFRKCSPVILSVTSKKPVTFTYIQHVPHKVYRTSRCYLVSSWVKNAISTYAWLATVTSLQAL